jgi:hypothetical protein
MKIASVETYLLRFPVDPGRDGASSKGWIRDRWGSAVGLAASPHLMAALPPCPPTGNRSRVVEASSGGVRMRGRASSLKAS